MVDMVTTLILSNHQSAVSMITMAIAIPLNMFHGVGHG